MEVSKASRKAELALPFEAKFCQSHRNTRCQVMATSTVGKSPAHKLGLDQKFPPRGGLRAWPPPARNLFQLVIGGPSKNFCSWLRTRPKGNLLCGGSVMSQIPSKAQTLATHSEVNYHLVAHSWPKECVIEAFALPKSELERA